jgi:CHASE2 domain-containing sensor protein/signal transduction histidine kinase
MWRRLWRERGPWLLLSATMLCATGVLTLLQPFPRVDRMLQDNARAAMGQRNMGDVVIVTIDDASLEAVGRWPWRRALHAEVLRRIAAQSPRCIGLDLLLTEQDAADRADDLVLAQAMHDSGCVVLPMALQSAGGRPQKELVPVPALAEAAAGIGHAHISLDQDGVARSVYLAEGFAGRTWPHFIKALHEAGEAWSRNAELPSRPPLPPPPGPQGPWLRGDHELVVFGIGDRPLASVSYIDVLRGQVPPGLFRDRYVLVGTTALGMGDAYATAAPSATGLMPGVQIFANMLQGFITERRVVVASLWQDLAFNVLPLAVALLGLLWLRPAGVLLLIVAMLGLRLGLHVLRPWVGVQFTPAVGFMALLVVYPAWSLLRLTAAFRFLRTGSAQLHAELEGFPAPRPPDASGDFLDRQMAATSAAALRMRDLHRFVRDGINHLPDATMVLDTHGRVMIANLAALRHWDAEVTGLAGRDAHELLADVTRRGAGKAMMPPGALRQSLDPIIDEGEDAQGRALLVRCVPFFDSANVHAGWLIALVDITRMRHAQGQRDEALRFISHDIREPSASILTILELARSRPEQFTQRELFTRIERHALTGLELADGFVGLARAEAQPFRPEPLDLVALLHQAADDAWAVARKRKVRVLVASGPEEALCVGDRALVTRALGNVLGNALKYSPPGCDVRCAVAERPGHWAVSVRDQGPGIAPELQSQLFQPFHRLHRDTHPDVHGVGLGLLLVRTVVQRHGGSVEIDSAVDAGSTVTLVLPKPTQAELAAMTAELE